MRKYNVNHDFFESIDTEEKAYWLGFIGADGCVSERYNYKGNKCSTLYVCLQEQDEAVLVALKHHLNAENPIFRRITNKNKKKTYSVKINDNPAECYTFSLKQMQQIIES